MRPIPTAIEDRHLKCNNQMIPMKWKQSTFTTITIALLGVAAAVLNCALPEPSLLGVRNGSTAVLPLAITLTNTQPGNADVFIAALHNGHPMACWFAARWIDPDTLYSDACLRVCRGLLQWSSQGTLSWRSSTLESIALVCAFWIRTVNLYDLIMVPSEQLPPRLLAIMNAPESISMSLLY